MGLLSTTIGAATNIFALGVTSKVALAPAQLLKKNKKSKNNFRLRNGDFKL